MPAAPNQPTLTSQQCHRNAQLFSDHYLDQVLPGRSDWQLLAVQAAEVRGQLRQILAAHQPSTIEAQTEQDLVRPVLQALGHTFEVQPSLRTPDGGKTPDYVLFSDEAARAGLKGRVLDDAALRGAAFGVAEAKHWDRPLDRALAGPGDPFNNKNPAYQIAFYVQHAGVPWGILTNGRLWRLVHRDTSHKLDRYYEVDLPALLQGGGDTPGEPGGPAPDAFLYFYAFFRRAAFDPGPLSLDALLAESADYAHAIGEGLKAQVYEALRHLAQGFLDYPANGLAANAASAGLKAIYDHSLIALYRLLFIFYAEARDLLPLADSPGYRDNYSLRALTRQVARDRATAAPLLADTALIWPRLRQLFTIINAGSPPLKVATFNGGLFDPARYPFLERYTVGDAHLEAALDALARVRGEFIDYRDLSERHLGTIYEGLLEHHLRPIPPEDGWTVDLFNDRGERKRTGSYYTPDAIVKYIVEQTVGPALDAALAGIPPADIPPADASRRVDAVLGLNCLDPAMGSGHFLVEVVEHIARFLVDLGASVTTSSQVTSSQVARSQPPTLEPSTFEPEPDLAYWKRRVAQSCVYGVDLNPLAVDLAKLSLWLSTAAKDRPLSFLDHHLRVGNSLVGARLADLAAGGSPGAGPATGATTAQERRRAARVAKAAEQAQAAGQASMLDDDAFRQSLSLAVGSMWLIEDNPGLTVADVKQQEQIYLSLRETLARRYAALADLATARRFGLHIDPELAPRLAEYAAGQSVARFPQFDALLGQVSDLAEHHRFFHWELEFPEVFFDRHGYGLGERAGFDVVVGNPPYVRQEALAPYKAYFADVYPEVYHGTADLFVYFFAQGMRQLRQDGRLSYIASNSWLRANYATPLRKFLREQTTVETIVDLGDNRVFADAPDVYPAIMVARKRSPRSGDTAQAVTFGRGQGIQDLSKRIATARMPVSIHDQADSGWQLTENAERRLFTKLVQTGHPLQEIVQGSIYRGVVTGLNEAFIIDGQTRERLIREDASASKIIFPLINGEDIRPWYTENEDRWLIFVRRGLDVTLYPNVMQHLSKYRSLLQPRPTDWDMTKPWSGRKAGLYQWYEIQDTVAYYELFADQKLMWPEMARSPRFTLVEPGVVGNKTTFMIPGGNQVLLGLLMSRVSWFCISGLCNPIGERKGMLRYVLSEQSMVRLPIPDVPVPVQPLIAEHVNALSSTTSARYTLHRQARHRILSDLGRPGGKLNLKLTAWWELDFPAFRAELTKVFGRANDIPLRQRDEWEAWLADRRSEHERLTAEIVRLETALNAQVYALFDLTPAEIRIIEESTKYRYGEV